MVVVSLDRIWDALWLLARWVDFNVRDPASVAGAAMLAVLRGGVRGMTAKWPGTPAVCEHIESPGKL